MREIKFRFYMTDYKKMSEPSTVRDMCYQQHLIKEDDILMQYTGLKDKNGVEIYEGDIVKPLGCLHDTCDLPVMSVAEIKQWQDGWYLFSSDEKDRLWHYCRTVFDGKEAHHNALEVIGNIYENPELIEKNHANA